MATVIAIIEAKTAITDSGNSGIGAITLEIEEIVIVCVEKCGIEISNCAPLCVISMA
jgi:hypothetical protein